MRYLLLPLRSVPAKPCSTLRMFGVEFYFVLGCFSLALESVLKEASQRIPKITAAGSSATAHCFALTIMERLFSPCTRLHDLLVQNQEGDNELELPDYNPDYNIENVKELKLDVSIEELLSAERAFTYADLYAMVGKRDTVAWLTPRVSIIRECGIADRFCKYVGYIDYDTFSFCADGKYIVALALSPEHLLEICDVILRLSAASVVHSVILNKWGSFDCALGFF
jgi:hypothetical protein